jgi:hypothetical protein
MQLAQQADRVFLGGGLVAQVGAGRVPDLLHGAFAIHQTDEMVRRRREAVRTLGRLVLQHEPDFAAKRLPQDARMGTDARLEVGNPVPRRAEQ